ncbi:MAG: carboxypeptidase regulatory-like domain-containing protein [Candidatus Heimdallarchaeaceae archaeon]
MKLSLKRKGLMKIGMISSVILALVFLFLFIASVFAPIFPGQLNATYAPSLQPAWVNLTKGDMFFTDGNTIYILANFSCSPPAVCNETMTTTANFSQVGGSENVAGTFNLKAADNSWAIYEFSDDVNFTAIGVPVINIVPKNITINATDANQTSALTSFIDAPVVLVNMSTLPSCPPPGEPLPTRVPLLNGTWVPPTGTIAGCWNNCTVDDRAQSNGTHWFVCGPTFTPPTTNFTQIADTGNFSNVPLVLHVPGVGMINFTTGVDMGTQEKAAAIFQFAVESVMAGGRIGLNETEWNGVTNPNKPNLNLTARLTLYNVSKYGITGRPQLYRYSHGTADGAPCPSNICYDVVWDGENLTFTVSSFSDYAASDAINVSIHTPDNATIVSTPDVGLWTVNFTYNVTWDFATINMKNCTLWGNFTGTWAPKATNSSALIPNTIQGILANVTDGTYIWNVRCYDDTNQWDTASQNFTVTVAIPPILNNTVPANNSYIQGISSQLFQVNVYDYNLNTSNVTLNYKFTGDLGFTRLGLECYGNAPSFVCNNTLNPNKATDVIMYYYFEATDNATNLGYNGTASNPLMAIIDNDKPIYTSLDTNIPNATPVVKGAIIQLWAQWSDNYQLDKWINETDTGTPTNSTHSFSSGNWSNITIDTSSLATGTVIKVKIYANDSAGNQNVTPLYQWTIDGTAPQYGNESVSPPSPIEYAPGRIYTFNISWSDNLAISEVLFEANFTGAPTLVNYSTPAIVNLGGNNYSITFTDLPANATANYTYRWLASDTSGNWNTTPYYIYNITKNQTNPINLYFNETLNNNRTYTYPAVENITAQAVYANSGTLKLYRNETDVGATSEIIRLGNGTYVYKANITGNANYTSNSTEFYIFVLKGTPTITLTALPGWTNVYPTSTKVICSVSAVDSLTANLYRDGADANTENNTWIASLAPGTYTYECNTTGNANYTSKSETNTMTIQNTGVLNGYVFLTNTTTSVATASGGSVYPTVSIAGTSKQAVVTNTTGYYEIKGIPVGSYTVTVTAPGYYTNSTSVTISAGATTTANLTITGPENYNFTLPEKSYHSFWDPAWHTFSLNPSVFSSMGITNHNFTNIFSSIDGNYTVIYGFNATSGQWLSFIRDQASNDFYGAASSIGDYYIYMNATDRVEVGPKYS